MEIVAKGCARLGLLVLLSLASSRCALLVLMVLIMVPLRCAFLFRAPCPR